MNKIFFLLISLTGCCGLLCGDDQKSLKPQFTINAMRKRTSSSDTEKGYAIEGVMVACTLKDELRFLACKEWLPASEVPDIATRVGEHFTKCEECQKHVKREFKQLSDRSREEAKRLLSNQI